MLKRNLCKTSLALIALAIAGFATSQPAAAASFYSITDLGSLNPTATGFDSYSPGYGINNSGQVVGNSIVPSSDDFRSHAFRTAPNSAINPATDDLGTLGGNSSTGYAINDFGQVVGESNKTIYGSNRAFLWNSTSGMQDLGTLGGDSSSAYSVNNSGQVVGTAKTAKDDFHAFLYNGHGSLQDLGTLGGNSSSAKGINNAAQVVGNAETASGNNHAFLYNGSSPLQDIGTLGGQESYANAINESGQVVGTAETGATYQPLSPSSDYLVSHAFLYNGSSPLQDLGTLGGPKSTAYGINNIGQVVGTADTIDQSERAFIYSNGKMTDLNSLIPNSSKWLLSEARGINNAGQIVGTGTLQNATLSYPVHAFLLTPYEHSKHTPVPEPTSTLGVLAFGALGAASRLLSNKSR